MGLLVMAATKLADAFFPRVLYYRGGGSCGGGTLYTLVGVTGSGRIVWMVGGARTLGGIRAGYRCGGIIGTLGSNEILNCGVGDEGLGNTCDSVWRFSSIRCKADIWASPNVANKADITGFRNTLTSLSAA